jgi:hypothetical protein
MLCRFGILLLLACTAASLKAQTGKEEKEVSSQDIYDASGNRIKFIETPPIGGSPYYNDNWVTGNVFFVSGKKMENANLRFNLHTQQLECKLEELTFPLVNPIREFNLTMTDKGITATDVFRNGYPPNPDEPQAHFYKLLWEKNAVGQLLQYQYASIEDDNPYGSAPGKVYRLKTNLYLWLDTGRKWVHIKNKQDMLTAFPDKADKIKTDGSANMDKPMQNEAVIQLLNDLFP